MNQSIFRARPFGDHQLKVAQIAASYAELLHDEAQYVAPGRYRSLFQSHLETAMMFLNKAIAFDGVSETPIPQTADDDVTPNEENENA